MNMHLKRLIYTITAGVAGLALLASALPAVASSHWVTVNAGDLLKLPDDGNPETTLDTAIYYFGADGLRYVFPNSNTYFTWYSNFNNVKEVGMEQLGTIGLGGNVTYRPGAKMIKIDSDPKTYAVGRNGKLHWVTSEEVARTLYGSRWNTLIDDMPDAFFSNYIVDMDLVAGTPWDPQVNTEMTPTISADKGLVPPVEVIINPDGSFTPSTVTLTITGFDVPITGRTVRFTNRTSAPYRVASNPHPLHNALPGFDSANIPAGLNYVYRFTRTGAWGYHLHQNTSHMGSVTVQ